MKVTLSITYSAEAEPEEGETTAEEEAALNKLAPIVEQFGQGIINAAMAEGLSVYIEQK